MTVRELIQLLQTMPPDAPVITTFCSDFVDVEPDQITLMSPDDEGGLIRHHGHLMHCKKEWLGTDQPITKYGEKLRQVPLTAPFLTCVHFSGN